MTQFNIELLFYKNTYFQVRIDRLLVFVNQIYTLKTKTFIPNIFYVSFF